MAKRRGRGEGSITQRHDHPTCPPLIDGTRAEHRCQGRWVAVLDLGWSAGRRQRKSVYGRTKREVQDKLTDLRLRYPAGGASRSSRHTVQTWMEYWLTEIAAERIRPQTMASYRSKINQYVIPLLGRHRLDRLEPRHIRDMYRELRDRGLSEATLRQTHAILSRALKVAVREEQTYRNVALLVEPPSTYKARRQALTVAEARRVLRAAQGDPHESRWYAALWLGLRQGEALGLPWHNVNLTEGVIVVDQALVTDNGRLAFDRPKSETSRRTLPLPMPVLSRLKVRWAHYLMACAQDGREPGPDALVWSQPNGRPIQPKSDWKAWRTLLANAEVPPVALHAARNTTSQLLEAAGVPARLVAEIMGHAHVSVTHRYQMGAGADAHRKALESLNDVLGS